MKGFRNARPLSVKSFAGHAKTTAKGFRFSLAFKRCLWELNSRECCYCGDGIATHKQMHVDHWIPTSKGGSHDVDNLVCSCARCNTVKGGRDIEYLRMAIAIDNSAIKGVINPSQAISLMEAGAQLPINLYVPFNFEVANQ